jgi:teichuronic acid biosynthesis glycosyltransferase TuaC
VLISTLPRNKQRLTGEGEAELGGEVDFSGRYAAGNLHALTLTPFYPSAADDGNGCFVSEPLEWTAKLGVRNTVMAVRPAYRGKAGSGGSVVRGEWLRYFSLPGGFGLPTAGAFLFARIVGKIRKLHGVQPIGLIHAHGQLPCGHAAMLLSKELNIPFVVSVHGLDAFSSVQVGGRSGEWCRRVSRLVYAASRRVICVSEHVREAVLKGMDRTCLTSVVYNGVDPVHFSPPRVPAFPVLKILSVGNLIPIKGHEHLIRAMTSLACDFPSLELDIIGDGVERRRLEALARRLHIADKVHFHGRQSRAQVAAAMQCCTIFALTSRYEGLGCVYLEAMSCGKPVVGCRGQGIAEIIQQGTSGCLVDPDDEQELKIVIGGLLRDPGRARDLGRVARDTILDRFTLEQQAENLVRIYRESLK